MTLRQSRGSILHQSGMVVRMLHGHAPLSTAASWTQLGAPAPALRGVDVLLIIARHPGIRARCRAREMPFYPPKNPIDNRFYVEVRAWDAHWGARAIKELGNLIGGVHVIQQVWMVIRHGTLKWLRKVFVTQGFVVSRTREKQRRTPMQTSAREYLAGSIHDFGRDYQRLCGLLDHGGSCTPSGRSSSACPSSTTGSPVA